MAMAPNPGRRGGVAGAQDPSGTELPRGTIRDTSNIPPAHVPRTADTLSEEMPMSETERTLRNATPLGGVGGDVAADDDVINRNSGYTAGRSMDGARADRGFTMTFAVAAVVLLLAFLVALYFGSQNTDTATAPTATQESITQNAPTSGTAADPGDTTGSTTTPSVPPASTTDGTTGTGTGSATSP